MRVVALALVGLVGAGSITGARAQSVGQVIDQALLGGRPGYNQRQAYEQGRFDQAHDDAWRRREWKYHHGRDYGERRRWEEERERSAFYGR